MFCYHFIFYQNICQICIHFWIKLEMGKIFWTKTIKWSTFIKQRNFTGMLLTLKFLIKLQDILILVENFSLPQETLTYFHLHICTYTLVRNLRVKYYKFFRRHRLWMAPYPLLVNVCQHLVHPQGSPFCWFVLFFWHLASIDQFSLFNKTNMWHYSVVAKNVLKIWKTTIWYAGLLGQMTRRPSVWCFKYYFV